MSLENSAGNGANYISTTDGFAHGGHDLTTAPFVYRKVKVRETDHPSTDRWITLTTTRTQTPAPTYLYQVALVDGHGKQTSEPREYPTLRRARNAANHLLNELETDQ